MFSLSANIPIALHRRVLATLLTETCMSMHDINTIEQVNTVPVGAFAGFFLLQPCFHLSGLDNQNLVYPWCKIANSAAME